ncbi:hypothetical protein FRC03_008704 [Tulasnella sp. 419]|nr:hypothetical protein FRC03_008704 [Tulasnella sp. 419]
MFNGMEYNNRVLKVHHDKFTQSSSPPPYSTGLAPPQLQHHSSSSYFGNAAALIPSSSTSSSLLSSNSAMTGSTNSPFRTTFAHNSSQPPSPFDPYPPQLQHNAYSAPLPTATVTQPTTYQDLLAQWSTAVSAPPAPQAHNNQLLQHQIETLHHPTVVERLVPVPPVPSPLLSKSRNSQSSSVSSPPPSTRLDLLPPSSIGAGIQAEKRDKDFGLLRMHSDELLRALQQPAAPSMKTSNSDDSGAAIKSKVMTTPSKRMTRSPSGPGSAHPGPITLPPPPFSPPKPKENDSPSLVEQVDGDPSTMSPLARGLPPMTPSMPGFTFYPQTATPPLYAHYLSPGIGQFSPPPRDAGAIGGSSNGPNASPFYPSNQGYAYNPHNGGLMMAMFGMHSPPLPVTTPSAPGGNNVGMLSPGGIVPVPMTPGVPMTPQQAGGPDHLRIQLAGMVNWEVLREGLEYILHKDLVEVKDISHL